MKLETIKADSKEIFLDTELNRGGFPVKNAGYWRREHAAMETMYHAQCACTDEWAEKYRAEVERKADTTLLQRVAELESALAAVNERLAAASSPAGVPLERRVGQGD